MELRHEGWQYACVFRKLRREKRIEGEKNTRRATARIVQKKND